MEVSKDAETSMSGEVGVVSARPCGGPLDGVDLLCVRRQVMQGGALRQAPDLGCVVV